MTHFCSFPRRSLFAACVASLVLAGCAAPRASLSPEADKAELQKRAQAYWDLSRANDNVAAWAYEAASKDGSTTLQSYIQRGGITYDAVEVRGVRSLDGDEAVLDVWMRFSIPLLRMKGQEAVAPDYWRRIGGVWHHVLHKSSALPDAKP